MTEPTPLSGPALRNPIPVIFGIRLVDAMGFGIVMPVLPKLLLHMGAPNIAAATRDGGLLLVTYALAQFFFGPVIGNLSDRFGRRPVILASLLAFSIDYALMGFAPSIGWLFVGRAIAGIAGAVYVPASALVADVTPPEQRARAFGLVGSAFGLGFVLGPVVGGFLGVFSPRAPFFAAAALAGVNFVGCLLFLPESLPRERRRAFAWRRANPFGAAVLFKHHPEVMLYALAMFAFLVGNNVYPSTWAFFATARFDWSTNMIGWSLAATGVAMAVAQMVLIGPISARVGEMGAARLGLTSATVLALAYAFTTHGWLVFVLTALVALQGITYPALNALMSKQIPANAQGELQGGLASLASVANFISPLMMSMTFAYFTAPSTPVYFPGAAFVLAAAVDGIGLLLLFAAVARTAAAVSR